MQPHHQETVDRLVSLLRDDPKYRALIIGGSIAKGWERPDSDVDIILIATDEEFARRQQARDYHYFTFDLCDYEGGYVDGKVVDLQFLLDLAERGNEPSRAAFSGAIIAFSHIPDMAEIITRITTYPEAERSEKIQSFYGQLEAMQWYVGEAARRNDRYLMTRMLAELVLYGGRLILAHNRILYPYHKWLMTALQETPDKPENLMDLIDRMLADPTKANVDAFCDCIRSFQNWEKPPQGWGNKFMEDIEWRWRDGCVPLADS
jgi:predicted nucleotidyltransferase